MEILRCVMQFQPTAVVLDDFLDDGEAKPGPLLARCHIGFCQTMTVFLGQADAIVCNTDKGMPLLEPGFDENAAPRFRLALLAALPGCGRD